MNTTLTAPQQLINDTKELWNQGKKVMIQVAWNLLKIRESGEWEKYGHKTFQQFCQEELDISQSQTSKLIQVADYYLEKYTPEEIGACDYERLYASTKLQGTPEENLSKALTWSRDDFKQNKAEIEPHAFVEVCYCKTCGLSKDRHP